MVRKNQFLYWRMENGHEHSFLKFETEDIMEEFAIGNEEGELTQQEYMSYIERRENTTLEDIKIIEFKKLNEEFAQSLLDNDYIAGYEIDGEVIIEFF